MIIEFKTFGEDIKETVIRLDDVVNYFDNWDLAREFIINLLDVGRHVEFRCHTQIREGEIEHITVDYWNNQIILIIELGGFERRVNTRIPIKIYGELPNKMMSIINDINQVRERYVSTFKIFEAIYSLPPQPKVGDYVIVKVKDSSIFSDKVIHFLNNNISKIISLSTYSNSKLVYSLSVEYDVTDEQILELGNFNDELEIKNNKIESTLFMEEIFYWGDNIEELKLKLDASKYNL